MNQLQAVPYLITELDVFGHLHFNLPSWQAYFVVKTQTER
jgi:hypothetical protein